jgi:hypothetical protein
MNYYPPLRHIPWEKVMLNPTVELGRSQRHIPEEQISHSHPYENSKPRNVLSVHRSTFHL